MSMNKELQVLLNAAFGMQAIAKAIRLAAEVEDLRALERSMLRAADETLSGTDREVFDHVFPLILDMADELRMENDDVVG